MAQKKKQPHIDKSPICKRKAKTWIKTYAGTNVVKDYRVQFKGVDVACAVREFQEIGYEFEPEYLINVLKNEAVRIEQIHREKEKKQSEESINDWQDDNFFFITGYTSGGATYGVNGWKWGLSHGRMSMTNEMMKPSTTAIMTVWASAKWSMSTIGCAIVFGSCQRTR